MHWFHIYIFVYYLRLSKYIYETSACGLTPEICLQMEYNMCFNHAKRGVCTYKLYQFKSISVQCICIHINSSLVNLLYI